MTGTGKTRIGVLICVPSFRGTIMTHTMVSVARTMVLLTELGIHTDVLNVDSAEIVVVRNKMANYAMGRADITHLLFVDDDMVFEPDAVVDLLRADKDIVGCICPRREISLDRFYEAARSGLSLDQAKTEALAFVTRHISNSQLNVQDGLCRVAGIGMGVTLIKMSVFHKMIAVGAAPNHQVSDGQPIDTLGNTQIYGFFDQIHAAEINANLSEDLSFCERWVKDCGGEVWALVTRQIGHIGSYIFTGTYIDRLKMGKP